MKRLEAITGIAASLAGLAVYVYLLGGVVMWLRFTAARLPADEALGTVDTKQFLAIGFKALVFGLLLLALIIGVAWAARGAARLRLHSHTGTEAEAPAPAGQASATEEPPSAWSVIVLGLALGIAVAPLAAKHGHALVASTSPLVASAACGAIGAFIGALLEERTNKSWVDSPRLKWIITLVTVGIALVFLSAPTGVAVIVLVSLAHFGGHLSKLPSVDNLRSLIPAVLILGGCTGLVVAAYLATPPVSLDRITVVTHSGAVLTGGYLGRSGDGIALTRCSPTATSPVISRRSHITIIPTSEVKDFTIGGASYAFDYGKNPSLVDLGLYYFKRDGIHELTPTSSIDLRADRFVCGLTSPFKLLRMIERPRAGEAREWIKLFGAGTVKVDGPAIRSASTDSDGNSTVGIPISPSGDALTRLRQTGHARVAVNTSFAVKGEDVVSQTREVDLHLAHRLLASNAR